MRTQRLLKRGALLVLEGIDGAGKATEIALLAKHFRRKGIKVSVFDFPRYETTAGRLIKTILSRNVDTVSPYVLAVPFALDRALVASRICVARERGVVLCNRYTPSNMAFHGARLPRIQWSTFIKFVEDLEYEDLSLPKPDLVIFLDIPVHAAQRHIRTKNKDRNERDLAMQKRAAAVYAQLARQKGWIRIDAKGTPNEVHHRILKKLSRILQPVTRI